MIENIDELTIEQIKELGYEILPASPFEIGLLKNGKGIRTWWNSQFNNELPSLDNPKIIEVIKSIENNGIN